MDKKISFSVDADVYEKFCLALSLTNETEDAAIEKCWEEGLQNPEWSWYVQFQRAAQIELWTGQRAPLDVMRKEFKKIIREENEKAQTEWFCNSVTSWEINVIVNL